MAAAEGCLSNMSIQSSIMVSQYSKKKSIWVSTRYNSYDTSGMRGSNTLTTVKAGIVHIEIINKMIPQDILFNILR